MNIITRVFMTGNRIATNSGLLIGIQKRYAGHSHWQNIKHTKGAKDLAKSQKFSILVTQIRHAIQEGGGNTNIESNLKLAEVLEIAKTNQMPRATIDKVIKRWQFNSDNLQNKLYAVKAPEGVFILIECLTPRPSDTQMSLYTCVKKSGLSNTELNNTRFAFTHKGVIRVLNSKPFFPNNQFERFVSLTKAEDIGIEVGAEEVNENIVESDDMSNMSLDNSNKASTIVSSDNEIKQIGILEFLCDVQDFHRIKIELSKTYSLLIQSAGLEYLPDPNMLIKVENPLHRAILDKFFAMIQEQFGHEITKVYTNIDYDYLEAAKEAQSKASPSEKDALIYSIKNSLIS